MSAWLAWVGAKAAGVWGKVAFAGAFIGLLVVAAFRFIAMGRKVERADATEKGVEAIKRSNRAVRNVDHSAEAIANDPNNLDR